MTPSRIRESTLVLFAFAVGAGNLLVAGSALAEISPSGRALFRIDQRSHGAPTPPVTPGGAGMYIGYVFPYYLTTMTKGANTEAYKLAPVTAVVEPFNPKGGAFSLPQSFFTSKYTDTLTPKTNWPGYTTYYQYHVYNGPGKFQPNNGYTPSIPKRLFFPTEFGNPYPNLGTGRPVTATETFDGEYDSSRVGSLHVTPGKSSFGGTFRLFSADPPSYWKQFITYFPPEIYYGTGNYLCMQKGKFGCTPGTFESVPGTTQVYNGVWWLLTSMAVAPGERAKSKATRPVTSLGTTPTKTYAPYIGDGTPEGGPASYSRREQHYLFFVHPWTTGYAKAFNKAGVQGTGIISPMGQGYDITHNPAITLEVKKYKYTQNFNKTATPIPTGMLTTKTYTQYTQVLKGVTRVVSMVRPRLTWSINVPLDADDPITEIWAPVRLANMRVYFLPEPGGMLALGVGIASLLGLSRIWRR